MRACRLRTLYGHTLWLWWSPGSRWLNGTYMRFLYRSFNIADDKFARTLRIFELTLSPKDSELHPSLTLDS